MTLRIKYLFMAVVLAATLFSGCQCSHNTDFTDELKIDANDTDHENIEVEQNVIEELVENISSPVETAALIKRLGIPFNKDYLTPTDKSKHFNTNFRKALGLGIYGADLGYLNMYEKTSLAINYISTVQELADGMRVGQFFDFSTLMRLAKNNENLDSLIYISQQSYNKIDAFLRSTNRASLSYVIVTGVWVEGMYLSTRVAEVTGNKQIIETITDQKVVLAQLMQMLALYERDPNIKALADRLAELNKIYKNVKITYEVGDPIRKIVNNKVTFIQQDKQIVEASPETISALMAAITDLRNDLIANE